MHWDGSVFGRVCIVSDVHYCIWFRTDICTRRSFIRYSVETAIDRIRTWTDLYLPTDLVPIIYLTGPYLDDQGMDFILEGSVSNPRFPVPIFGMLKLLWNLKQREHIGLLIL